MRCTMAISLLLATGAAAQVEVHGVRANGDFVRFDVATGTAYTITNTGVIPASGWDGGYWDGGQSSGTRDAIILSGVGANANTVYTIAIGSGSVISQGTVTGLPAGYTMAGVGSSGGLSTAFLLLTTDNPGAPDLLAQLNTPNVLTIVGSTGRTDLTAITGFAGGLYAIGTEGGGALYSIHPTSGAASLIGGQGTYGADTRAITTMPDGALLAAGAGLRSVDPGTGVATLIGPTGFTDIVGLATSNDCYVNCDGGGVPVLNVQDFTCFLQRYAAGEYYANCDRSTTPPTLNVADFTCFLQRYAAGCP
jgi:hypothetical protein